MRLNLNGIVNGILINTTGIKPNLINRISLIKLISIIHYNLAR